MKNLKWAVGFALLIAVCAAVVFIHRSASKQPKTAKIIQDGEVIRTIDLQTVAEPYEFEVLSANGGHNTVRVENGKIAVTEADCPDKICVRRGFIENGVLPIVCLPHKLSVVIEDGADALDAVSGGMPQ